MEEKEEIVIYTDGACSGNPGPGGWAAVLIYKENRKEISGGLKETTNNVMELTAVIEALKTLKRPCKVHLYSDSAYVVNAFLEDWISGWIKNNWKNNTLVSCLGDNDIRTCSNLWDNLTTFNNNK